MHELLLPPENSFHRRGRSPSLEEGGLGGGWKIEDLNNIGGRAMRELLPPLRRFPSLEEGGLGLHALSRSLLYNSGCRVATLLVLMGVMGFLGDLRGRNSKSPPNPLGLAERVPRPQRWNE